MPGEMGGAGLWGLAVLIIIIAIGVVVGITINDHLQSWIDGAPAATPSSQ